MSLLERQDEIDLFHPTASVDRVLARLGKWLVIIALVLAMGGHWAVLQSVAWAGMIVSYAQTAPLSVAFQKTFSGQHPCKLCKVVENGKKSEGKKEAPENTSKLELFLFSGSSEIYGVIFLPTFDRYAARLVAIDYSPPEPPPRYSVV